MCIRDSGKVFEIQREDFGEVYKAALKIITVPQTEAEIQGAMEEGMSPQQAEQYFYGVVEDIVPVSYTHLTGSKERSILRIGHCEYGCLSGSDWHPTAVSDADCR